MSIFSYVHISEGRSMYVCFSFFAGTVFGPPSEVFLLLAVWLVPRAALRS